jgi:L-ascorbate metabolism protein UlaG (beta-lactamase superfamily)
MSHTWRTYADWAKTRPMTLRLAGWLGRGRGRFRWFDELHRPPRPLNRPDVRRWRDHRLAAAWLGHATILLRMAGLTILTDPVMSSCVGVGLGLITAGPRRCIAPALSLQQLPEIDLILISHAHFDHLDRPTLARLPRHIPIITADKTADLIEDLGFKSVRESKWGESLQHGGLRITAQQVRHWGARTFYDQHRGYNAYLLEGDGRRVLYGGDSAYQEHFKSIGKVDLAILGIGAYDPWIQGHANPEQAWEMAQHVDAKYVLPMHHSTFKLSHEPMDEPIRRLEQIAGEEAPRIIIRRVGETWVEP